MEDLKNRCRRFGQCLGRCQRALPLGRGWFDKAAWGRAGARARPSAERGGSCFLCRSDTVIGCVSDNSWKRTPVSHRELFWSTGNGSLFPRIHVVKGSGVLATVISCASNNSWKQTPVTHGVLFWSAGNGSLFPRIHVVEGNGILAMEVAPVKVYARSAPVKVYARSPFPLNWIFVASTKSPPLDICQNFPFRWKNLGTTSSPSSCSLAAV
jgi:hypothetical protein